ncbi:MAG: antibiotic biosynthesis monooxygenase [Verrucomicrobia bacterium]|nr:antibiotic biosynthesis monooxygenase [Verrucomicrobiota bacterium]
MNAESLTVTAQIKAKPGKDSQVRQELLSLVAPSREEAGCLN